MNMRVIFGTTVLASLGLATSAFAGTANGTLDVRMTVANNCTLLTGGAGNNAVLDFGNQNAGVNASPINGTSAAGGDITLSCTGDTPGPQISFSAGSNASGNQRRLNYGGVTPSLVQYNLFIDSGRATPLIPGQFYNLVPDALSGGLVAGNNSISVYGQIPTGENLVNTGAASYTDTVTFQITY